MIYLHLYYETVIYFPNSDTGMKRLQRNINMLLKYTPLRDVSVFKWIDFIVQ